MKKLVLIVAIVAFSTLMSASMASAQNNGRGSIEGTYEMISSGICLHSTVDSIRTSLRSKPPTPIVLGRSSSYGPTLRSGPVLPRPRLHGFSSTMGQERLRVLTTPQPFRG